MKCGFCERELEDIYSLSCMALVQEPRRSAEDDVEPYDDSDDWQLPSKHPAS